MYPSPRAERGEQQGTEVEGSTAHGKPVNGIVLQKLCNHTVDQVPGQIGQQQMQSLLPDVVKDMRQVTAVLDLEKIAGDKEKERHMVGVVGIQAAKGEMLCPRNGRR